MTYELFLPQSNSNIHCRPQDCYTKLGDSSVLCTSKLQLTIPLPTTKARYHVFSKVAKDILYLRWLLIELGESIDQPTLISSDNKSCIKLVDNPNLHSLTNHIAIQDHFVCDQDPSAGGFLHQTYYSPRLQFERTQYRNHAYTNTIIT